MSLPHNIHPDLDHHRLSIVADVARSVWRTSNRDRNIVLGDTGWSFGACFYDRTRTALKDASLEHSWLRIIEPRLYFVFTIGEVPIRFYRGDAEKPKKRYFRRSKREQDQHQIAFAKTWAKQSDWIYRLAVEASFGSDAPTIKLVQHSISTHLAGEHWEIGIRGTISNGVLPSLQNVFHFQKDAKFIPPPSLDVFEAHGEHDEKANG